MLFELKTDLHYLRACIPDFLALAGGERWKKRAVQLGHEVMRSPALTHIVAHYHWLELALSAEMGMQEAVGGLVQIRESLESLAALYFAQMVVEVHRRVSRGGQAGLEGRIRDSLKADTGFASLYLEMEMARRLIEAGFEVEFSDLEGVARYDLRFWKGGTEGEVECKSLSTDAGRKIHRKDFYRFIDTIGPAIAKRVEACSNEVLLITLEDRLPADTMRQKVLRTAAGRMLAEASLARVQGDFFTITREDLRPLTAVALPDAANFYQVCCTAYGNNCHVSGATTSGGGCLVVMRSSKEDDHSKPLLEALKKAAIQFSATRPAFIAVQFDDIMPTDLLLSHLRRRVGLLSYHLFHGWGSSVEVPATHVVATYFCPYGGLHVSPEGIGAPAFVIINPKPGFHVAPGEYSPFLSGIEDAEFALLLGASPPTENLSFVPIDPRNS